MKGDMMKAKLAPLYFREGKTARFETQMGVLAGLLSNEAEMLPPRALGDALPDCDGVVFPEIIGEAYRMADVFRGLAKSVLVVTSEFGTFSMWDWEIMNFLRGKGVATLAPHNLEQARLYCRMLAAKAKMAESKFLIFQDNPGEGFQPEIFKSFYWWERECVDRLGEKFGLKVEYRSLRELGKKALRRSERDAMAEWDRWRLPVSGRVTETMALNASRLYLALRDEIDSDDIIGMGTNCLNESRSCDTTPCIAWDRLFEERDMLWVCEGDIASLASKYMIYKSFAKPVMMTNIYPFLMGDAATKHEKIPGFPEFVDNPDNHILLAHCGYFGLLPRRLSAGWTVREKALAIVDENAHVFDARMEPGAVTLSKIDAAMERMMSVPARLKGYAQYDATSDCRNGGVVEVADGRAFLAKVYSHHIILTQGDISRDLDALGTVFGLAVEHF